MKNGKELTKMLQEKYGVIGGIEEIMQVEYDEDLARLEQGEIEAAEDAEFVAARDAHEKEKDKVGKKRKNKFKARRKAKTNATYYRSGLIENKRGVVQSRKGDRYDRRVKGVISKREFDEMVEESYEARVLEEDINLFNPVYDDPLYEEYLKYVAGEYSEDSYYDHDDYFDYDDYLYNGYDSYGAGYDSGYSAGRRSAEIEYERMLEEKYDEGYKEGYEAALAKLRSCLVAIDLSGSMAGSF